MSEKKTPISIRLSADEMELLERVKARYGDNQTKAIVESLKLTESKRELTNAALLAEIKRRLK